MGSHSDEEHGNPEMNAIIRKLFAEKADEMTKLGMNRITAGGAQEKPIYRASIDSIEVTQMPDDPLALRISIGSPNDLDEGNYLVFRGDPQKIERLLSDALFAMRKARAFIGVKQD